MEQQQAASAFVKQTEAVLLDVIRVSSTKLVSMSTMALLAKRM